MNRTILLILLAALGIGMPSCRRSSAKAVNTSTVLASPSSPEVRASAVPKPDPRLPSVRFPSGWPHVTPLTVEGAQGMVVTDNAHATEVGRDVLRAGGNAADAAVATAFALAVTYPTAGNLGGGGFAVTRFRGVSRALDFRETAPSQAKRDMYLDAAGRPKKESQEGILAAAVPGSVAGLWELYQALGSKKKGWADLLAPAIRLAEQGFVVDEAFRQTIVDQSERLKRYPTSAALFLAGGTPPLRGSMWKNGDLANVLKRIAKEGPAGFYEGMTADAVLAQMKASGGIISRADLRAYRARWRAPLEFGYRGARITSMPPPSSGGITLAMICHIVEGFDLAGAGFQTAEALHPILEAMRRSFAARNAVLGDPDFVDVPLAELMSDAWAMRQRSTIEPDRATPSASVASGGPASGVGPHTTHFGVVDADGNAVALTTTLNWWYGSGVTVGGAGFVLNNEMDDFAVAPGLPNGFGLVQGEANAIAPGKRMLSSMSPTLVTGPDGAVLLVAGAAGGPTIITAVFQEISNLLDYGLDPGTSVDAPRFHMQHLPDVVTVEEHGITDETRRRLQNMGYSFQEKSRIADAPAIARLQGAWVGVAEPRRAGGLAAAP